jgi:hypothetical protein
VSAYVRRNMALCVENELERCETELKVVLCFFLEKGMWKLEKVEY